MKSRANMNKNNRVYYQRHKEEILARRKAKREENKKYKDQLAQATDLLKKMYYLYFEPCVTHKDLENRDKLFEEVKQFIKE